MRNIKVVIGANYGDEGKGLVTDYFCRKLKEETNESGIVVMSNGGAQRGHTVELPEGTRHIFHHFGSGTFRNYDTFIPKQFIVNPAIFCSELKELSEKGIRPIVLIDFSCKFTTPYDMVLNQLRCYHENRTNSCGLGIWETIKRYWKFKENGTECPTIKSFLEFSKKEKENTLHLIRAYYYDMLNFYGLDTDKSIDLDDIDQRFIQDCEILKSASVLIPQNVICSYNNIVFESAQGLLLDINAPGNDRYTTPTHTGLYEPMNMIENQFIGEEIEVCYVSRTYLTRHGQGPLENECKNIPELIGFNDKTNIPNKFQGSIRFGTLNSNSLLGRISYDFSKNMIGIKNNNYKFSVAFTHANILPPPSHFKNFASGSVYHFDSSFSESGKKVAG